MRIAIATCLCAAAGCGNVSITDQDAAPPGEDGDQDGVADAEDNCPGVFNPGQENGDPRPTATARSIPFAFRPTPTGTGVTEDDGFSQPLAIGFPFQFFGRRYERDDQVRISSNGFVILGANEPPDVSHHHAAPIPSPFWPNAMVAGYWSDLDPETGGQVTWELQGEEPARELVVEFTDVPHADTDGNFPVTMQIVLREEGSQVEVHCKECVSDGEPHSQGVEDQFGRFGAAVAGRSERDFALEGDGVLFETGTAEPDPFGDACDSCPDLWSADQNDVDGDGIADACDNCVSMPNQEQRDGDLDGVGDDCDLCRSLYDDRNLDEDRDGVGDECDSCEEEPNPGQEDADGDEVGDACDNCPDAPNDDQADSDQDGIGDACDTDPPPA